VTVSGGSQLSIRGLEKSFPSPRGTVRALTGVNLEVARGEFVTIIGPSGCGKSTLLKIVAGLEPTYEGSIELDGHAIKTPGPDRAVVFQEHRLFPWLTVEKNIASNQPLRRGANRARVHELVDLVKLTGFEKAYLKELSGGMAQRVSIARGLMRSPEILLLDEPFGALDAFTREHMQEALLEIWRTKQTTMLFVTHDIDEALFLGTRVVVMSPRPGRIHEIVPVDLPTPRDRTSKAYTELRTELVQIFARIAQQDAT
jgi:sulfonate transport system ATP-binding protein